MAPLRTVDAAGSSRFDLISRQRFGSGGRRERDTGRKKHEPRNEEEEDAAMAH